MSTPTVVLDQQVRNGTFDTSSVAVPTGPNPDTDEAYMFILLDSTMSAIDAANPAYTAIVGIKVSLDGSNYDAMQSYQWVGGQPDIRTGVFRGPSLGITLPTNPDGSPPARVMGWIDTSGNSLNTGLTLDFK